MASADARRAAIERASQMVSLSNSPFLRRAGHGEGADERIGQAMALSTIALTEHVAAHRAAILASDTGPSEADEALWIAFGLVPESTPKQD